MVLGLLLHPARQRFADTLLFDRNAAAPRTGARFSFLLASAACGLVRQVLLDAQAGDDPKQHRHRERRCPSAAEYGSWTNQFGCSIALVVQPSDVIKKIEKRWLVVDQTPDGRKMNSSLFILCRTTLCTTGRPRTVSPRENETGSPPGTGRQDISNCFQDQRENCVLPHFFSLLICSSHNSTRT